MKCACCVNAVQLTAVGDFEVRSGNVESLEECAIRIRNGGQGFKTNIRVVAEAVGVSSRVIDCDLADGQGLGVTNRDGLRGGVQYLIMTM